MTIRPENTGILSEEEIREIEQWEAKIDRFLREEFDEEEATGGWFYVSHSFLGVYSDMKVNIRRELIRRYEKAGWRVTYGRSWKAPPHS